MMLVDSSVLSLCCLCVVSVLSLCCLCVVSVLPLCCLCVACCYLCDIYELPTSYLTASFVLLLCTSTCLFTACLHPVHDLFTVVYSLFTVVYDLLSRANRASRLRKNDPLTVFSLKKGVV